MKIGLSLFAVAAAALLVVGCGGDKGGEDEANYDGWMLTRWKDGTALTGTVYLQLGEDGTFTLYQSIGTFGYARFTGTYALVGDPAVPVAQTPEVGIVGLHHDAAHDQRRADEEHAVGFCRGVAVDAPSELPSGAHVCAVR
jgi:hypothetical protein